MPKLSRTVAGLFVGAVILVGIGPAAVVQSLGRPAGRAAAPMSGPTRILQADEILDPPQIDPLADLRLSVSVSVTYDAPSQLYTYAYTVTNQNQSNNHLDVFGVAPVPKPTALSGPPHWDASYGWEENKKAAVWSVGDDDTTHLSGLNITLSQWNPAPNTTTTGFTIVSRQPPATVTWYAQGFDTLRFGENDEELPGSETLFTTSESGTTQGPDITSVVGVDDRNRGESQPGLKSPKPNPAKGTASITFYLERSGKVVLGIFDVSGRRLRFLVNEERAAGLHQITWDGQDDTGKAVQPGVYFYQLLVDGRPLGRRKVTMLE